MTDRLSISDLEQMYSDIMKGLSVHFDSPFITDILETARRFPRLELGYALNRNQVTSKTWLVDSLYQTGQGRLGRVGVLVLAHQHGGDARGEPAEDLVGRVDHEPLLFELARRGLIALVGSLHHTSCV